MTEKPRKISGFYYFKAASFKPNANYFHLILQPKLGLWKSS